MKLHIKILISLILISLMPLLIVVLFYDYGAQKIVNDNVSEYFKEFVIKNGDYLDLKINELEKGINSTVGNDLIQDALSDFEQKKPLEKVDAWINVNQVIDSVFALNTEIRSIIFYMYDETLEIYGEEETNRQDDKTTLRYKRYFKQFFQNQFRNTEAYKKVQEVNYKPVWIYGLHENYDRIYLMRELINFSTGESLGIIIFAIDTDILTDTIEDTKTNNGEKVFILDENNRYIISEDQKLRGQPPKESYIHLLDQSNGLFIEDEQMIAYSQLRTDWIIVSSVPVSTLTGDITNIRYFTFFIGIICLLIAVFISILFSRYVAIRFNRLITYMERVEKGDLNLKTEHIKLKNKNDEITTIYRHFFRMIERLKQLINKNYIQQIEKKEAELNALQYQINPHFLNNTLEIINAMSKVYECEDIGVVSQKLGEMFRYNMHKGGELIQLENEIQHIRNYIYLTNMHYNNGIQLFVDVDESIMKIPILRFILQPIVENCIKHGFKQRGGYGCVEITAKLNNSLLVISVHDDGIGIPTSQLNKVNKEINLSLDETEANLNIGLRNVNQRIKLAFGKDFGIWIGSIDGMGTAVDIQIPIEGEQGEDDENISS